MTGTLFLLILCLFLAAVFLWVARTLVVDFWARRFNVPRDTPGLPDYWHATSLGAAVIFLILAGMMAHLLVREWRAPAELAQIIPVYPNLTVTTAVPTAEGDRHWLFASDDPPGAIAAFYEALPADSSWSVQRRGDEDRVWLEMERDGTSVLLFVSRDGQKSQLMYRVTKADRH